MEFLPGLNCLACRACLAAGEGGGMRDLVYIKVTKSGLLTDHFHSPLLEVTQAQLLQKEDSRPPHCFLSLRLPGHM